MTTPTEPFAQLSLGDLHSPETQSPTLNSPMASPEEVKRRALGMQDVLSSFRRDELPTETQVSLFQNVVQNMDRPYENRPPSTDWTVPGDLEGSLLQWGSYSDSAWEVLSQLQTASQCAIIFQQKIITRFKAQIEKYDELERLPPPANTVRESIKTIAEDMSNLSDILREDRERREHEIIAPSIENQTLVGALTILENVCKRTRPIIPASKESSRRTRGRTASSSDPNLSLFAALIRDPPPSEGDFLLQSFEHFSAEALFESMPSLTSILQLLSDNKAPNDYLERFGALQDKANDQSQRTATMSKPSGAGGRKRGHEAESKGGTKRTQPGAEESSQTPKRGRKIAGK